MTAGDADVQVLDDGSVLINPDGTEAIGPECCNCCPCGGNAAGDPVITVDGSSQGPAVNGTYYADADGGLTPTTWCEWVAFKNPETDAVIGIYYFPKVNPSWPGRAAHTWDMDVSDGLGHVWKYYNSFDNLPYPGATLDLDCVDGHIEGTARLYALIDGVDDWITVAVSGP